MKAYQRYLALLLLFLCTLSLLACESEEKKSNSGEAPSASEDIHEEFLGGWYDPDRPRVYMTVAYENGDYNVCIRWNDSAFQVYEWRFTGRYEGDRLVSSLCSKVLITYTSETTFTEDVIYQNGVAALYFNEDGKLCWQDTKENAGVDCRFQKNG